jgi:salicylate hydroxylase
MTKRIAVAGAGIGGLTAALALIQRGFDVIVFEQTPQPRETGAGVQLGPNGTRVLLGLGLEAPMRRVICPAVGKEIRLWNSGRSWTLFDLGETAMERYGAPYWMVHRGDLHAILLEAVRALNPDALRLAVKVTEFTEDSAGVTLALNGVDQIRADVLVGADGVHSCVRQHMFGASAADFTGLIAWRGLVPAHLLPMHQRRPIGVNWIGPGRHVVTYPVRRGELLNFVGVVERTDWRIESWTERGNVDECALDFAGWHEDIQRIIRAIDVPYKWALLARAPLPRLVGPRVALLGDAAHPMLPFLAQGANMAIEDGMVLARCLQTYANIPEALRRYDAARFARTSRAVLGSLDNAARFHNPALATPDGAADYVSREWQPARVAERYGWAFEYDAMAVPV